MTGSEIFAGVTALSVSLYFIGIVLMVVELCIQGFGVCGVSSIICIALSVVISSRNLTQGLLLTAIALATLAIIFVIFLILASKGIVPRSIVLKDNTPPDDGFVSSHRALTGREGVALTDLHPAGCAEIDGQRVDVVSEGGFIPASTKITVREASGSRVVVAPLK